MPKVVDHDGRRREIAGAVLRVLAREGIGAVSVRRIADEVGWSSGAIRHYLPTLQALRSGAVALADERIGDRVLVELQAAPADLPPVELAAHLVEHVLPFDEVRREEFRAWAALSEWSSLDGDDAASRMWDRQRELYRTAVGRIAGVSTREPLPPDLEAEAEHLHLVVDGVAVQTMYAAARVDPV